MKGTNLGKVWVPMTVTNRVDEANAIAGMIESTQVRQVQLTEVLIDTGATTLCLPAAIIAQLGLPLKREVQVSTAMGMTTARIFEDAKISLAGRDGTFECLELPGGRHPLVGVIPLEALGLEPDLKNQTLRVLSDSTEDTYLTILPVIQSQRCSLCFSRPQTPYADASPGAETQAQFYPS